MPFLVWKLAVLPQDARKLASRKMDLSPLCWSLKMLLNEINSHPKFSHTDGISVTCRLWIKKKTNPYGQSPYLWNDLKFKKLQILIVIFCSDQRFKSPNMAWVQPHFTLVLNEKTNLIKLNINDNLNYSCSTPGPFLPDQLPSTDRPVGDCVMVKKRDNAFNLKNFQTTNLLPFRVFCLKCPLCKYTFARMSAVWRTCLGCDYR